MFARRLLLALLVLLCVTLLAEGALSLFAGRTLGALVGVRAPRSPPPPRPPTDAERHAGALGGYYAVHEDPLVRYVLRPDAELRFVDATASTDAAGQRRRPGPPPPDDALRLVVLGDSVAFGYGVADDETLAVHLEDALATTRGAEARPVACFTVGAPSWNHRAALHYLVDHWDALRPDVVVYMPVVNDLSDGNDVYETGSLRMAPDPSAADPWLFVSRSQHASVEDNLRAGWTDPELGPRAVETDLSPESSRRYDENAASIVALHDLLLSRGARLLVIQSQIDEYAWHLHARVRQQRPDADILFLERTVPVEMTLVVNNHPNAETLRARAVATASHLVARGVLDAGAGAPLPELPELFRALLTPPRVLDELDARSERQRVQAREALRPRVDLRTGEGFRQVFGGLNLDGSVRLHCAALLPAAGDVLRVGLAPLRDRPDRYPLAVDVDIDGAPAGRMVVEAARVADASFPLPPGLRRSGRPFEVRLRPEGWCVVQDRGRSQVASCRLMLLDASARDG